VLGSPRSRARGEPPDPDGRLRRRDVDRGRRQRERDGALRAPARRDAGVRGRELRRSARSWAARRLHARARA
jgi:hypothetical protein